MPNGIFIIVSILGKDTFVLVFFTVALTEEYLPFCGSTHLYCHFIKLRFCSFQSSQYDESDDIILFD